MKPIPNEMIVYQVLKAMPEVWTIYRFGSAGMPFERPDSDIDLAILAPNCMDNVVRWELAQDLARRLRRDVDLVDLQCPLLHAELSQRLAGDGRVP